MARRKRYTCAAEKQAAYRDRLRKETVLLDRRGWEQLQLRLERLQEVIQDAATRGDDFARQCRAASQDTMLEKMTQAFERSCLGSKRDTMPETK